MVPRAELQQARQSASPPGIWRRWLASGRSRAGDWLRRMTGRLPEGVLPGPPEGLTMETLAAVCQEHFGSQVVAVTHRHLSGWKTSGAFRVTVSLRGRAPQRLIFKNADYGAEAIPALDGLPVLPGPPEYLIYKNARGPLAAFLPKVYLSQEVEPRRRYHYLLEDLLPAYYAAHSDKDRMAIGPQLLAMQRALEASVPPDEQAQLLCYDQSFVEELQRYFADVLERLLEGSPSEIARRVGDLWPRIAEEYSRPEYQQIQERAPIHGDLNASNVMLPQDGAASMKVIDWEWAGTGVLHADLASLLKSQEPGLEQQVALAFFRQDERLSMEEHRQLYLWCQLERALMDASYVGAQSMAQSGPTKFNLPAFAESSLEHATRRYEQLIGQQPLWDDNEGR